MVKAYYAELSANLEVILQDPDNREAWIEKTQVENLKPTYDQDSGYVIGEKVKQRHERVRSKARSELASRAGRAKRGDSLTREIERIVENKITIMLEELLDFLDGRRSCGLIDEVGNGVVAYRTDAGGSEEISFSSVAHRLRRAKTKIRKSRAH